ncbi:MAG: GNAT family N-acetyltransferase [Acidobacteria bacterium]|nr:GNAT family N-acetyltransferase [Acidobacteriota bacterium]
MNVKQATVADIPAIQALFTEAIHWQEAKGLPTFAHLSAAFFAQEINKGAVFLAEVDDQIVGTISLYEADDKIWDGDPDTALYIHRLISRRGAAGRGVGAALLEWSHKRAAAFDKQWLRVDSWANNEELCRFYESQGFHKVRRKNTGTNEDLPEHYQNIILQLFQMPAKRD